jgi:CrcB protein
VALGGFFGATARYTVSEPLPSPFNTLAVNVLGSFALGMLMYSSQYLTFISPRTRLVLGTGFMGSFTTYSTFAVQTYQLSAGLAFANIFANTILALAGVLMGRATAIHLSRRG